MRSFCICLFLLFWSGASYGIADTCAESHFSFTNPNMRNGEGKVEKAGCLLRFLVFRGKGEKWEVDVCNPHVGVLSYLSILDGAADTLPAGSQSCPLPLFGADFSSHHHSAEDFDAAKERIWVILKDVKRNYLRPGREPKGIAEKNAAEKFECLEQTLKTYLNECKPQNWDQSPMP